jgi:hypothetical protein
MSKGKKLLNEDTVKRFMKLAGTEKLYESVKLEEDELEEEKLEEQVPGEEDEALGGPPPEALEPEADLDMEPEVDLDMEPEGEPGAEPDPLVAQALAGAIEAIGAFAAAEYDLDIDVEREGEEPGLEEPGLEEPGLEEPGLEGPDFLPAAEEEEEGLPPGLAEARRHAAQQELFMEELSRRVANRVKREHIVEQVTKRVARRLQGAKRRTKK